jgi:hypothetical protein
MNKKDKKSFRDALEIGERGGKKFLSRTFASKLFLKLCSQIVGSSFLCFQILSFEPLNRSKEDIKKAIPWLKTLKYFYDFITLEETEESSAELLMQLAWVLFRKSFSKNKIVKKFGEKNNLFNIILEGDLIKLDLIISREILSLEEYLIYLIKLKLMKEHEMFNKARIMNKSYVKLDENNIKSFCNKNHIKNYEQLRKKAISELNELGYEIPQNCQEEDFDVEDLTLISVENYINIFNISINSKRSHEKTKAYFNFYILKFKKNGMIKRGSFFGNFLKDEINPTYVLLCNDKCEIGEINKDLQYDEEIYESILIKKKKLFKEFIHNFFMFYHVNEEIICNNYSPYIVYRKYFKGEKLFLQNSCFEGVYFLKEGEVKLSINTCIDEMYNLMTYFTYALNSFNDYVSGFATKEYITEQIKHQNQRIQSHHNLDFETVKLYLEIKNYIIMSLKDYNIIGTNESFDHQTEIYNFTAECISNQAIVYFFPKEFFNIMLNKEKMVYNSFIQLVEFRIKDIIWKIKYYINIFENKIKTIMAKKLKITEPTYSLTDRYNNENFFNNKNIIKNESTKNISDLLMKRINFSYSKDNIFRNNKYKNLFLSQDTNRNSSENKIKHRNNLTVNSSSKTIYKSRKFKIEDYKKKINDKLHDTKRNNKIVIKPISTNFPYLIMDSFVKRKYFQENKVNLFPKIKTFSNDKKIHFKIKK